MAADCRSAPPVSQSTRRPENFLVSCLVASNYWVANQTLAEVKINPYSEPSLQVTTAIAEGKVSIVIPCFNQGAMLREALASIEKARNANLLEVIVVDDGSSDGETMTI